MRGKFVKALAVGGLLALMVVAGVGATPAATPHPGGTPAANCTSTTGTSGQTTVACRDGGGSGVVQCTTATGTDGGTAVRCFSSTAALRAGTGAAAVITLPTGSTPPPGAKPIPCLTRPGASPAGGTDAVHNRATCYYIGSGTPPTTLPAPPAVNRIPGTPPAGSTEVPCGSLAHPPKPGTAVFKSVSARDGAAPVARCYVLKSLTGSPTP